MGLADLERFERERLEADRLYNDALTALDRAVAAAADRELTRADFDRTGSALLGFLQRITAFVETKERLRAADGAARVEALAPAFETIAEMRTQLGVLQRTVQMLARDGTRAAAPRGPVAPDETGPPPAPALADVRYLGFEDEFRGTDAGIREKLAAYLPLFAGARDVVDLGCGRGEFLALLRQQGVPARGVDLNDEMTAVARERGLDAVRGDALAHLQTRPEGSIGGLFAAQVVEHLTPNYLLQLLDAAHRALRPGAPIVLETINPACWLAFFSSYLRDFTHVTPVHPETLQYLLRASGFERVELRYSAPVSDDVNMKTVDLPAEVLASSDPAATAIVRIAHAVNANAVILNNLLFSHLDYAAIGYRS